MRKFALACFKFNNPLFSFQMYTLFSRRIYFIYSLEGITEKTIKGKKALN